MQLLAINWIMIKIKIHFFCLIFYVKCGSKKNPWLNSSCTPFLEVLVILQGLLQMIHLPVFVLNLGIGSVSVFLFLFSTLVLSYGFHLTLLCIVSHLMLVVTLSC